MFGITLPQLYDVSVIVSCLILGASLGLFVHKRKDIISRPFVYLLFFFISIWGFTHFLAMILPWTHYYLLDTGFQITTTLTLLAVAGALWWTVPKAASIPSTKQLNDIKGLYHASFTDSPLPTHMVDINGYIIDVSKSWLAFLGYSETDIIKGRHITDFQQPLQRISYLGENSRVWTSNDINHYFDTRPIVHYDRNFVHRDGSIMQVRVSYCNDSQDERYQRNDDPASAFFVGTLVDLTAQLKAQEALQETETRYRTGFENSPVPMQIVDTHGIIIDVSPSWLEFFGYTSSEVIGHSIIEFRPPGSDIWSDLNLKYFKEHGEILGVERQFLHKNGAVITVLKSARIERHLVDNAWIIAVLIDITETRRMEAALKASEDRYHQAQKMEAVGQLSGGIAHDFNNLLQIISGDLSLIEGKIATGKAEEAAHYIAAARSATDKAANLTNRMLAFSRRQVLQPVIFSPTRMLYGAVDMLKKAVGSDISIIINSTEGWHIDCDSNELENTLLNLALNAREAMQGGSLTFTTANLSLNAADLSEDENGTPGDFVEIAVTDTGTGMTPEVLSHAIEPFFTTRPFGGGTGLGLSQVYGFLKQSGGFIRIKSSVGDGTTVSLFLPRKIRPVIIDTILQVISNVVNHVDNAINDKTILVVEDEEHIREIIVGLLTNKGYAVLQAEDGTAGLRIVRSSVYLDFLLTDVGLPGLNGRQLADQARLLRPNIPVLFITGYAGMALEDQLAPGMQVLRKPFDFNVMITRVGDMINKR